ncbi:type II toxin-antitoxin system PemK/MazF family toxin [Candidatus Gracilibacteria bacterium]|nr:type II toxin-antitoxin system PemK/MazF family toxin [Candidatus Gracilibacteria bacterium]
MNKFDIILVDLNPVKGSEQAGIRPCIIIQNDFANKNSKTFVIAIISSIIKDYPHTLIIENTKINGLKNTSRIDLLQIRTIDKERIISILGKLDLKYKNLLNEKIKIAFGL